MEERCGFSGINEVVEHRLAAEESGDFSSSNLVA